MHEKHQQSSHGNGFILGVIVGALLTLLFTTKKGRRILRMLTEEGMDKFSEIERLMQQEQMVEEDDEVYEEPVAQEEKKLLAVEKGETKQNGKNGNGFSHPKRVTAPHRRFFRGVSKKS